MTEITVSMNNRGTYYLCAIYPVGFNCTFDGACKTQYEAYANAIRVFERNGFKMSECTVTQEAKSTMDINNMNNMNNMFKYFSIDINWDFGPDAITGEPTAWETKVYTEITREQAVAEIRLGNKNWIVIRTVKGPTRNFTLPF